MTALLAGFAALTLAVVLGAGAVLARPAYALVGEAPADLAAEQVSITGGSGAAIRGWFSAGRPGFGAVLLLHPLRGNRTSMLGRARFLHRDGYAVLLIDLQAHGETLGRHITFGALESVDARAAAAYLRMRAPEERVAAIGWSLGGAAALIGADPLPVNALVLEAVYPTIEEAAADRLRMRLGALGPPLVPLLTSQLRMWTGIRAATLHPIDDIPRLAAPLLLIAGARDPRTPLPESRRLFAAAPSPKELWVVTDAGHDDFHATHREEYEVRVGRFFRVHLRATE